MIQEDSPRQSNESLKYKIRRSGPLDAYIYKERADEEDVKESQKNVMIHLPRPTNIDTSLIPTQLRQRDTILHIFTDGACTNNGKKNANAAWGALLVSDIGHVVLDRFSGVVPIREPQTNQRAELRALLRGLEIAEEKLKGDPGLTKVQIWSDSEYSIKCASVWGPNWKRNGWKKQGGEIQHLDIIQHLVIGTQKLGLAIEYKWLKGHKGGDSQYQFPWMFNHQVDALATGALR
jgi:ribonuclease HI